MSYFIYFSILLTFNGVQLINLSPFSETQCDSMVCPGGCCPYYVGVCCPPDGMMFCAETLDQCPDPCFVDGEQCWCYTYSGDVWCP